MTTDMNTAFRHCLFLFAAAPPPACLLPSQQIPDSKKHPGNAFCLYPNAGGTRTRRRWGYMYQTTNVLAVVGARPRRGQGSVESMDFPDIFCLSYMFSLRQVGGKKTDISVPCPMSRSAKQDLPFVRLLSVVFLSANEFWKSENSREKVHTRCPWLHVCIVYLVYENCKSMSYGQFTRDGGSLKSIK